NVISRQAGACGPAGACGRLSKLRWTRHGSPPRSSRKGEALSGIVTDRSAYLFCDPGSRFAWPG
ncbi:MAG: hypothetical protein WBS14_17580, partial [Rhodomicrobium sp.]